MTRPLFHDAVGSYQSLFLASMAIGAMAIVLAGTLRSPERLTAPTPAHRLAV